jgi:hypothetical protein
MDDPWAIDTAERRDEIHRMILVEC